LADALFERNGSDNGLFTREAYRPLVTRWVLRFSASWNSFIVQYLA